MQRIEPAKASSTRRSPGFRNAPRRAASDSASCARSLAIRGQSHRLTFRGRGGKISGPACVLWVSIREGLAEPEKEESKMSNERENLGGHGERENLGGHGERENLGGHGQHDDDVEAHNLGGHGERENLGGHGERENLGGHGAPRLANDDDVEAHNL